jgi:type II secretory pathway component HofQ
MWWPMTAPTPIVINDIPKVMPIIDRLLTQLDRKTQEVEIEARVVAATRQFARDIGTQLGFAWGNGHSAESAATRQPVRRRPRWRTDPGYITVPSIGQHDWFFDSVVLEPGIDFAFERFELRERQQQRCESTRFFRWRNRAAC